MHIYIHIYMYKCICICAYIYIYIYIGQFDALLVSYEMQREASTYSPTPFASPLQIIV